MSEHNKTLGISYALHMLLKSRAPFSQSSTLYYEKLHFLTVKKIVIWYKFLLLLDRVFQNILEHILAHNLSKGIEAGWKLFLIYTLQALVGAM